MIDSQGVARIVQRPHISVTQLPPTMMTSYVTIVLYQIQEKINTIQLTRQQTLIIFHQFLDAVILFLCHCV